MNTYEVEKGRIFYQAIQNSVSNALPAFGSLMVLTYAGLKAINGEP